MRIHALPCAGLIPQNHFRDTVENKVPISKIKKFLPKKEIKNFPKPSAKEFSTWGLTNNDTHLKGFRTMANGDLVLFYKDYNFFRSGRVLFKFKSKSLAKKLWHDEDRLYENVFLIDESKDIDIDVREYNKIAGIHGPTMGWRRPLFNYRLSSEEESNLMVRNLGLRNFWWVNQGRTHKEEIEGSYMWSPKVNRNGSNSEYYNNMRRTKSGDIVFSYYKGAINNIGIVTREARSKAKPKELAKKGESWNRAGWMVEVDYCSLSSPFYPKKSFKGIKSTLPHKFSPLKKDGSANQAYLFNLPSSFVLVLINKLGEQYDRAIDILDSNSGFDFQSGEEEREVEAILKSKGPTEREQLYSARLGQGKYKKNVAMIEKFCRLTGVNQLNHLIASHIKPWKPSNDLQRLDGNNGLLLAPHIDHLFDRGYISFKDNGDLIISKFLEKGIKSRWKITQNKSFPFNSKQKEYLKYHRLNIFEKFKKSKD